MLSVLTRNSPAGIVGPIVIGLVMQMYGGPSKLVGPITIQTANGKTVTNPAFEFDACFDTT